MECKIAIKRIGIDTSPVDLLTLGFHLENSPSNYSPDIKESNIIQTDFAEEDGVDIYIGTAKKSFDYDLSLMYLKKGVNDANTIISQYCNSLVGRKLEIYNYYKGVMITGYFTKYKDGDTVRTIFGDLSKFTLTFLVPKPSECNFNFK